MKPTHVIGPNGEGAPGSFWWFACESPDRPVDKGTLFVGECDECELIFHMNGLPIPYDQLPDVP